MRLQLLGLIQPVIPFLPSTTAPPLNVTLNASAIANIRTSAALYYSQSTGYTESAQLNLTGLSSICRCVA